MATIGGVGVRPHNHHHHHHHHHHHNAPAIMPEQEATPEGARWRKPPLLAKQVCCLMDSFAPDDASQRALLHLKYLNESCMNLECEDDLKVLSVTLVDGSVYHSTSRPDKCASTVLVASTRICFVYRRYHVAFLLDMSSSMYCVAKMPTMQGTQSEFTVPRNLVLPVMRTFLKALHIPLSIPVSGITINAVIKVTVLVRFSNFCSRLVEGVVLEKETTEQILYVVKAGLETLEKMATAECSPVTSNTTVASSSTILEKPWRVPFGSPIAIDSQRFSQQPQQNQVYLPQVLRFGGTTAPITYAPTAESLLDFLQETIAALQYIDPIACPCAIMITDGAIPQPNAPLGDPSVQSLVTMTRLDIPLHFVHLSPQEMINGGFGVLPDISNLLFSSSSTGGTCFDIAFLRSVLDELSQVETVSKVKKMSKRNKRRSKNKIVMESPPTAISQTNAEPTSGNGNRASRVKGLVEEFSPRPDLLHSIRLLIALFTRFSQLDDTRTASSASSSSSSTPPSSSAGGSSASTQGPNSGVTAPQPSTIDSAQNPTLSRRYSFGSSSQLREDSRQSLSSLFIPPTPSNALTSSAFASETSSSRKTKDLTDGEAVSRLDTGPGTTPFYSVALHKPAIEPRVKNFQIIQPLIAIDNPYPWHGRPPAAPVCVNEVLNYRVCAAPSDLLLCRLKDGFALKQVLYDPHVFCVRLTLAYAPQVTINYVLKAGRLENPSDATSQLAVSIRIAASKEFFKAFNASNKSANSTASPVLKSSMDDAFAAGIKSTSVSMRLHHFLNSLIEGDRVMAHIEDLTHILVRSLQQSKIVNALLPNEKANRVFNNENKPARRHSTTTNDLGQSRVRFDRFDQAAEKKVVKSLAGSPIPGPESVANALFCAFSFESLLRWHRWFHVESYDLLFQTHFVNELFATKVLGDWASFISGSFESGVVHFFKTIRNDPASLRYENIQNDCDRQGTEHFVTTKPAPFLLGRICFVSSFVASLHLAFPSSATESSRYDMICRLLIKIDESFPGRIKKFKQSKKPVSELCAVSIPQTPNLGTRNRGMFLSSTQNLLNSFSHSRSWTWNVGEVTSASFLVRGIFRSRLSETFLLTSSTLPMRMTGSTLDIDESKAVLDPNGSVSFCKLIPTFDVKHSRQSKDLCLIQYKISFPEPGVIKTEFWMESSIVHFKPFGGHLIDAASMFRILEKHFETVDSDLISTSIAFLQIQGFASSNLLSTWTTSSVPNASRSSSRAFRSVSQETDNSEGSGPESSASPAPQIYVRNGVPSFLQFGTKGKISLEVFKSKSDSNPLGVGYASPNSKFLQSFSESMEKITDARLYDSSQSKLATCEVIDVENEEFPSDYNQQDSRPSFFTKVLDVNSILVLRVPMTLCSGVVSGMEGLDSNEVAVPNSLELELYEIDCRDLRFPPQLVDPQLRQLFGYRDDAPRFKRDWDHHRTTSAPGTLSSSIPLVLPTTSQTATNPSLQLPQTGNAKQQQQQNGRPWRSKLVETFEAQVHAAHLYDMVFTVHWVFASSSNKERVGSLLEPDDVDGLLHRCPCVAAMVDASLLRTILSVTLTPSRKLSNAGQLDGQRATEEIPSNNSLTEIDERFESILAEFFHRIPSTSFYYFDSKQNAALFEHDYDDHDEEEDEEDDTGEDAGTNARDSPLVGEKELFQHQIESSLRRTAKKTETLQPIREEDSQVSNQGLVARTGSNQASTTQRNLSKNTPKSMASLMAGMSPPVFFRICCTTQTVESTSLDDSNVSEITHEEEPQKSSVVQVHSPDITDGRICEAIMGTAKDGVSSKVFINLIFCTLPGRPTRPQEAFLLPPQGVATAKTNDQHFNLFQEKLLWVWTKAVRRRIRARVKAMVSSAVLTALQRVYPVTGKTISLVQQLLDRGSLPSDSITRVSIPLSFANQEMGVRLFAEHIGKTPVLTLRRVGASNVYFLVEPLVSHSVEQTTSNLSAGTGTFSDSQMGMSAFRELFSNDLDLPLSIAAPTVTLREEWNSREYTVPYWAIITVLGPAVSLEFHHPTMSSSSEGRIIMDFLKNGIRKTVERVNQMILLHQMHETKLASRLLIAPDSLDEIGASGGGGGGGVGQPKSRAGAGFQSRFSRSSLAARTATPQTRTKSNLKDASTPEGADGPPGLGEEASDNIGDGSGWNPNNMPNGRLACPCYYRESFPVLERLHISVAMHELRQKALHLFIVSNRRNTFVYRDRSGPIYYLILKEVIGEDGAHSKILLEVYGVDPPPAEMKDMLSSLLSSKIASATQTAISLLLQRNHQFKIQAYDLAFIQSSSPAKPLRMEVLEIPATVKDVFLFLLIFKQNLSRFMNQLHFGFSPDAMLSASSALTSLGAAARSSDSATLRGPSPPPLFSRPEVIHPAWGDFAGSSNGNFEENQFNPSKTSPIYFLASSATGDGSFSTGGDRGTRMVELRREDFGFFLNIGANHKTKAEQQAMSEFGSGIAVSFASLCRRGEVQASREPEERKQPIYSQKGDDAVQLENFEVISLIETVDDSRALQLEIEDPISLVSNGTALKSPLKSISPLPNNPQNPDSQDFLGKVHRRRRSWAALGSVGEIEEGTRQDFTESFRRLNKVPSSEKPQKFAIVVEMWQTGSVSLDKLWNRHERAFSHALQEYAFECDHIEKPLRLDSTTFDFPRGDLAVLDSLSKLVDIHEHGISPSFDLLSAEFSPGSYFESRKDLLLELSKLIAQHEPDLCQLSVIDSPRTANQSNVCDNSLKMLRPFPAFSPSEKSQEDGILSSVRAETRTLHLVASSSIDLSFHMPVDSPTRTNLPAILHLEEKRSSTNLSNIKALCSAALASSSKFAHMNLVKEEAGKSEVKRVRIFTSDSGMVRADALAAPHCVVSAVPSSSTSFPAHVLPSRMDSTTSTTSTGSEVSILTPANAASLGSLPPKETISGTSVNQASGGGRGGGQVAGQNCMKKRHCYAMISVSEKVVAVLLYNWPSARSKAFWRAAQFHISWGKLRAGLLRNIFYQRLGLFTHEALCESSIRFLAEVQSRLKSRTKENSILLQDLTLVLENPVPPGHLVREMTEPDEGDQKQVPDVPKPMPAGRDPFMIARAAMESRKRGSLRGPNAFSPIVRQPSNSTSSTHTTTTVSTALSSSGSVSSLHSAGAATPPVPGGITALGSSSLGSSARSNIRSRSGSVVNGPSLHGPPHPAGGMQGSLPKLLFESQLRGQLQHVLLRNSPFNHESDPVRKFGCHLVQEAQYWGTEKSMKKLIRSVVIRWRQEWMGHSILAQYPFPSMNGFDGRSSSQTDECCWCTPLEFQAVLGRARTVHGSRSPTFLEEHNPENFDCKVSVDGFTKRAQANLIRYYLQYASAQLGMRPIVVTENENVAHGKWAAAGALKEGSLEAFAQRVLNGGIVVLHIRVVDNIFKCGLRLLEPDRTEEMLFSGSAHDMSTAEDFFMMSSSRPMAPTYTQDLGRIRSNLNVSIVVYDFHIFMFQRTLRYFRKEPVGIACQVFHFAKQFATSPAGAQNALMRQKFQFLCGVQFTPAELREVFQFVVNNARRYGMVGMKPKESSGKHFLFLSCNNGSFANPFKKRKTGVSYSVIVGEIGDFPEDDRSFAAEAMPEAISLERATSNESSSTSSTNRQKRSITISLDVCLMASDLSALNLDRLAQFGADLARQVVGEVDSDVDIDDDSSDHSADDDSLSDDDFFSAMRSEAAQEDSNHRGTPSSFGGNDTESIKGEFWEDDFDGFNRNSKSRSSKKAQSKDGDDKKNYSKKSKAANGSKRKDDLDNLVGVNEELARNSLSNLCSMEEAFDNVDLFLHRVFSHAVLRFQRKVFWKKLNLYSSSGGLEDELEVKVSELYQVSEQCDLTDIDPTLAECLSSTRSWEGLVPFLKKMYTPFAIVAKDSPKGNLILLPSQAFECTFVLHVHAGISIEDPPRFVICFSTVETSRRGLGDVRLFLTAFVQTLYSWIWSRLPIF